ncbi:hypothetical protein E2C01_048826 [Portunus trituberculatus]|uniref:Uncharacterized protein n=1 Tax=Portunus trituberculatus TaxID=210409 RepID=A0A5B7GC82_PORTR|nr:hypothetical protein [Portunus trituberculatus]
MTGYQVETKGYQATNANSDSLATKGKPEDDGYSLATNGGPKKNSDRLASKVGPNDARLPRNATKPTRLHESNVTWLPAPKQTSWKQTVQPVLCIVDFWWFAAELGWADSGGVVTWIQCKKCSEKQLCAADHPHPAPPPCS